MLHSENLMSAGRVWRGLSNQGQTQSGTVIELALNQLLVEGSLCCIHLDLEDKTVPFCIKISMRFGSVQGPRWHRDT